MQCEKNSRLLRRERFALTSHPHFQRRGAHCRASLLWLPNRDKVLRCAALAACHPAEPCSLSAALVRASPQGCAAKCAAQSPQPSPALSAAPPDQHLIHPADGLLLWDLCLAPDLALAQVPASAGTCSTALSPSRKTILSPRHQNQHYCYQTLPGRDICYLNVFQQMKGMET